MGCADLSSLVVFWGVISKIWLILVTEYIGLLHKETIMHRHDRHNTTILSVIHNISTTCSGQYYFWPLLGWIQLSEKSTQYII